MLRSCWNRCFAVYLALLGAILAGNVARGEAPPPNQALESYVKKADTSYGWKKRKEGVVAVTKYVELTLTSQTWRDITWNHQLFILKPSNMKKECTHGLLFIAGGGWKPELADPATETKIPREAFLLSAVAEKLGTPVAVLLHVPQQPIFGGKVEDQIIAHTFKNFLETEDPTWPLLLPMVKSAVRGMDAVTEFSKKEWEVDLKSFTVTGASKRGWTTWLTGAIDPRVTAIAPMVIDTLRMDKQMELQKESFGGGFSEQIGDYTELGLEKFLPTPRGQKLLEMVDPYRYKAKLTQPKLIILGTNDPYWPLEACNLYWNDLSGEKYLLYCPNNVHGLTDYPRIIGAMSALHNRVITGKALPKLDWKFANTDNGLQLSVTCDTAGCRVRQWLATSDTKDFRKAKWTEGEAKAAGSTAAKDTVGVCDLAPPASGYAATFAEVMFNEGTDNAFSFSTNVQMISAKK